MPRLCDYKDLPAVEGHPPKAAWGFYASGDPSKDQLGRESSIRDTVWNILPRLSQLNIPCIILPGLNLLTPEVVQAAAQSQIKTGLRVQLDWPLNNVQFPSFGRQTFTRTTIDISNPDHDWIGCDDKVCVCLCLSGCTAAGSHVSFWRSNAIYCCAAPVQHANEQPVGRISPQGSP